MLVRAVDYMKITNIVMTKPKVALKEINALQQDFQAIYFSHFVQNQ